MTRDFATVEIEAGGRSYRIEARFEDGLWRGVCRGAVGWRGAAPTLGALTELALAQLPDQVQYETH